MSVIKLTLPFGEIPVNGKKVTFTAPCSCMETEALQIEGEQYTVVDALCRCVTGIGGRWIAGAVVTVVLDVDNKRAYLQTSTGHGWTLAATTEINLEPNTLGSDVTAPVIPISAINALDTDEIMVEFSGEFTVDATAFEEDAYANTYASYVSVESELHTIAYAGEKRVLSIPHHRVVYKKHKMVNTNKDPDVYVYFKSPNAFDWSLRCDPSTGLNSDAVNAKMNGDTQVSSLVGTVKIYTKSLI